MWIYETKTHLLVAKLCSCNISDILVQFDRKGVGDKARGVLPRTSQLLGFHGWQSELIPRSIKLKNSATAIRKMLRSPYPSCQYVSMYQIFSYSLRNMRRSRTDEKEFPKNFTILGFPSQNWAQGRCLSIQGIHPSQLGETDCQTHLAPTTHLSGDNIRVSSCNVLRVYRPHE